MAVKRLLPSLSLPAVVRSSPTSFFNLFQDGIGILVASPIGECSDRNLQCRTIAVQLGQVLFDRQRLATQQRDRCQLLVVRPSHGIIDFADRQVQPRKRVDGIQGSRIDIVFCYAVQPRLQDLDGRIAFGDECCRHFGT